VESEQINNGRTSAHSGSALQPEQVKLSLLMV
jgi:hypothetical protein